MAYEMRISDWSSDVCSSDLEACWAWKRDYMCHAFSNGNDCTALETNASCSFLRTEGLDEELNGACQVEERIYRCPTPGGAVSSSEEGSVGTECVSPCIYRWEPAHTKQTQKMQLLVEASPVYKQ